ncbi:MAG: DUF1156 domain-containing protein [Chloroflexi bacterium]|nr:DUF1156 domain-containing protein [Chloroflexota bacterium]
MEQQFPVAKVSMESYKERKAGNGQTLTGLGKWWGRKPLVLVRASLLGLLLPATDNPEKDRDIFLKLMTMDPEGLWRRKSRSIPTNRLLDELLVLSPGIQRRFLDPAVSTDKSRLRHLTSDEREELQRLVFDRMSYSEKLPYCDRPEQMDGPSEEAWNEINTHLGTHAASLPELVEELGQSRFGHHPRVGDAFCGGGSIPFETARLGCDAYGSDLNPVAALLTWASLNIVGGGEEVVKSVETAQEQVYEAVDRQITEWGIEHNSLGWRADIFLYCIEVQDPESGWWIPLAPGWVIAASKNVFAKLVPDEKNKCYEIEIVEGASEDELEAAKEGTVRNSRLFPPHGGPSTPIEVMRRTMRMWENQDIVPRSDDVFRERLYCIRWVETFIDERGREQSRRHYRAPNIEDIKRESKAIGLLQERFNEWQEKGYIPSRRIEPGAKTDEPIRTRGWTYWHHLFNARQLLLLGLLAQEGAKLRDSRQQAAFLLGIGRASDWNSRLARWNPTPGKECIVQTYGNQALNTLYNYGCSGLTYLKAPFSLRLVLAQCFESTVTAQDARITSQNCDMWVTDPPYGDAVNYHELTEFYLAWYEKALPKLFPSWYVDSKRALAVQGSNENFRRSMVDCYRRLAEKMPDNGLQIVMFTHQDAAVWADLTMILWAAGLRVTAAWTIATETDSALKQGNYVQGTVLLVLRKRIETESLFLDEITHQVEAEVRRQLDTMLALEDNSDPNFGDADYQLAAYAAALRVLTSQPIEEIDPVREILRPRSQNETRPVEHLIRNAVKIACDHLVPRGLDPSLWKRLSSLERFYLKGLEVESHGEYRNGVYQELARGFGAADYTDLLASAQANETRLKSAGEMGRRLLSGEGFGASLVRQCLFAIHQVVKSDETSAGLNWLKTEIPDYWDQRERTIQTLDYLARLRHVSAMTAWQKDGHAAALLAGAVRNDHV